ncbi:MAG: RNA polymerase sigma factor [Actinomycetota bacterium]|nr:RNA polymerase sigma factor [Actinomycetota bacterium]
MQQEHRGDDRSGHAVLTSDVDPVLAAMVDDAMTSLLTGSGQDDRAARTSTDLRVRRTVEGERDRPLASAPHDVTSLYVRHRQALAAQARRFLRDPRDVDEVVQETFLRLLLALPELETELQVLKYTRRTLTNLCIDRYRAERRRPSLLELERASDADLADDEVDDPVVRAEDAAVVRDALARLAPLHRAALVKREIEEKPLPVIAAELGVAEDAVKHLLFRARRAAPPAHRHARPAGRSAVLTRTPRPRGVVEGQPAARCSGSWSRTTRSIVVRCRLLS